MVANRQEDVTGTEVWRQWDDDNGDQFLFFALGCFATRAARKRSDIRKHVNHLSGCYRESFFLEILGRSALGLVSMYSLLPDKFVVISSVSDFQAALQNVIIGRATAGCEDWAETLSPRRTLMGHPVQALD